MKQLRQIPKCEQLHAEFLVEQFLVELQAWQATLVGFDMQLIAYTPAPDKYISSSYDRGAMFDIPEQPIQVDPAVRCLQQQDRIKEMTDCTQR